MRWAVLALSLLGAPTDGLLCINPSAQGAEQLRKDWSADPQMIEVRPDCFYRVSGVLDCQGTKAPVCRYSDESIDYLRVQAEKVEP